MRGALSAAVTALITTLIVGCGGGGGGSMPTPVDDEPSSTTPTTQTTTPSPAQSTASPSNPSAKRPLVYVVGGRYDSDPAVQGLKVKYPVYFRALVQRDSRVVAAEFPRYFYADTVALIDEARAGGWIMRPPGGVVVRALERRPGGIVRISTCRSQSTEYWNPKTRRWVISAPQGSADVVDMARRGSGWTLYRWLRPVPRPFSCAGVKYPA